MTGRKHLWSGDWQSESEDPPGQTAAPVFRVPESRTEPLPVRRPRKPLWQVILPAAAILLVVAVALAETLPGRTSGHRTGSTAPQASALPNPVLPNPVLPPAATGPATTPATTVSGRTVNWLGMQISTVAGVGVVIQTVQLGSPADAAGLDPGDIIQTVNRRSISAATEIQNATSQLKAGDAVEISVARGSTIFSTVAAFAGHPTTSP